MAGTYTKRGNKYRLQYMKDGQRYSTTVDAKTDKEAKTKLAEFVTEVEKGLFYNTNYTFFHFSAYSVQKHHQFSGISCTTGSVCFLIRSLRII